MTHPDHPHAFPIIEPLEQPSALTRLIRIQGRDYLVFLAIAALTLPFVPLIVACF